MPTTFEQLRRWYEQDWRASSEWRAEAEDDYGCVSGEAQWSDADRAIMREQLRPIVTFNRLDPIVDAVTGAEVANRQEVHYLPVELGDVRVNELLTSAGEWVRDQCQAEDEESDSFRDLVICGMGWTDTRVSYEDDPRGQIIIERCDPLEMLWDRAAKRRNLQDASRVGRVRSIDIEDARAMFPDASDEDLHAAWADDPRPAKHLDTHPKYQPASGVTVEERDPKERVTMVEYQYYEREPLYVVQTAGAVLIPQRIEVDGDQWGTLKKRLDQIGEPYQAVSRTRKVYYRAIAGSVMLTNNRLDPQDGGFRFKCITGKRDRNRNVWYGLVKGGKDPQKWANKWLSQVLHIVNSNAKGGILAERGAFANTRKAEESWSDPAAIVWMEDGAIQAGKVKERAMAQYPAGIDRLMEHALLSVRECMGVNPELLGQVAREQAGVLEYQRRQAGMTILATMFDALRLYRKLQGKLLLHLMMRYLADGRLIRIVGEEGEKYVPLLEQEGVTEYDVKVDEAPSSPNQKERVWQMLQTMLPMMARMQVPGEVWAEIVRYAPLPASMAEKLSQALMQPQQPDPMHEAQVEETKASAMQKQSAAALNLAKAQETGERVKLDALEGARETVNTMSGAGPMERHGERTAAAQEAERGRQASAIEAERGRQSAERQAQMALRARVQQQRATPNG